MCAIRMTAITASSLPKCPMRFGRVRTPYAMLADNDDFLGFNGIERALEFLEANSDYVAARGRPTAFSVYSGLGNPGAGIHGRFNGFRMNYECEDVSASEVAARLRQGGLSIINLLRGLSH